jgi:DedD protein
MAKADSAADPVDPAQTLKRQARRRLVGALILGSAAAVSLPMLLDHEPRYQRPEVRLEAGSGQSGSPETVNQGVVDSGRKLAETPQAPAQAAMAPSAQPAPGSSAARAEPAVSSPRSESSGSGRPDAALSPRADAKTSARSEAGTTSRSDVPAPSRVDSSAAVRSESSTAARVESTPRPESPRPATRIDAPAPPAAPREAPRTSQSSPASPPAPVPSAPPQVSSPVATAASGNHVLQLGAFAQPAGARAIEDRAAAMGLRAWRETVQTPQGERIRVRVGPFPSRVAAEEVRSRLKAAGMDATLVSP